MNSRYVISPPFSSTLVTLLSAENCPPVSQTRCDSGKNKQTAIKIHNNSSKPQVLCDTYFFQKSHVTGFLIFVVKTCLLPRLDIAHACWFSNSLSDVISTCWALKRQQRRERWQTLSSRRTSWSRHKKPTSRKIYIKEDQKLKHSFI